MKETVNGNPKELNFYGEGKAESIKLGFAITSLRNPKPDYEYEQSEIILAACKDDEEKIPVIVVSQQTKLLKDISIPVLALDGFFSPEHAAEGMKIYPGYEETNEESILTAITFVKVENYQALHPMWQHVLTTKPLEVATTFHALRHIFFPTMAFWLAESYGSFLDWAEFLVENKLINNNEFSEMTQYKFMGTDTGSRLFNKNPKMLQDLSTKPDHEDFGSLILGLSSKKHY